jgi:hypothetical protein
MARLMTKPTLASGGPSGSDKPRARRGLAKRLVLGRRQTKAAGRHILTDGGIQQRASGDTARQSVPNSRHPLPGSFVRTT